MPALSSLLLIASSIVNPATAIWRLPYISPPVISRFDPIISPGIPSTHVHTLMGGTAFNLTLTTTYPSCPVRGDFSNCSIPQLCYRHPNGSFLSAGATIYFLQHAGPSEIFPVGLGKGGMAGRARVYMCLDCDGTGGLETTEGAGGFLARDCVDGLRVRGLGGEGHYRGYMAYLKMVGADGVGLRSDPVRVVGLFYGVLWGVGTFEGEWNDEADADEDGERKQPLVWRRGDPAGCGLGGDFLMGWGFDLLQRAVETCTSYGGRVGDCAVFELDADKVAGECKVERLVDERVTGVLSGSNVAQDGSGDAAKGLGCGNGSSVSVTVGGSTEVVSSVEAVASSPGSIAALSSSSSSADALSSLSGSPAMLLSSAISADKALSPVKLADAEMGLPASTNSDTFSSAASGTTSSITMTVTKIHSVTITSSASADYVAIGPSTSTASMRSKHAHARRQAGLHGQQLYGDDLRLRKHQRGEEGS